MKYISIGASIIKQYLDIIPERKNLTSRRTTTIYSKLSQTYNSNYTPLIEVSEGHFYSLTESTSIQINLSLPNIISRVDHSPYHAEDRCANCNRYGCVL